MYNRLFTKILDSSIWLESDATRIVWITLLAAMDEDGFAPFSCNENLARRANVPIEALESALETLQSPDKFNPNQEFEGRRIERVESGWMVIKAPHYRSLLTREIAREQTRIRVQKHRAKSNVTNQSLQNVTDTECNTSEHSKAEQCKSKNGCPNVDEIYDAYPRHEKKPQAIAAIQKALKKFPADFILERTKLYASTQPEKSRFTPLPATWFNAEQFNDDPAEWQRDEGKNPKSKKPWDTIPKPRPEFGELYGT